METFWRSHADLCEALPRAPEYLCQEEVREKKGGRGRLDCVIARNRWIAARL